MRKQNIVSAVCVFAVFLSVPSTAVSANSLLNEGLENFSITKYMPIIIGGTVIVESLIILFLSDIKRIVNVPFAALVANVASFLVPRLIWGLLNGEILYEGMFAYGNTATDWLAACLYLAVTLVIELPVIWLMLRRFTDKTVRLMWVTVAANVFTTVILEIIQQQIYNSLLS